MSLSLILRIRSVTELFEFDGVCNFCKQVALAQFTISYIIFTVVIIARITSKHLALRAEYCIVGIPYNTAI